MQNIEKKLESTLGKKTDLDSRLQSASSSVLTQKIEFQESSRPHSSVTESLKGKYVNLAPAAEHAKRSSSGSNASEDAEGLPQPKQILFTEPLDFSWDHQRSGTGFGNNGNTCFLNATLQVLIHCPPLANYMISGHHSSICRVINCERCIMCSLQYLTKKCLFYSGGNDTAFYPKWFTNNLQYIGRHFRCGRQEDAHEFLRLSLEKMQKCALIGYNSIDQYSKETTVINKIFGGYLRSQVICCRCGQKSSTYDPLLDVSLDIKSADNIERAFQQFVSPEKLDNDNAYKCEKCKQKVPAFKKITIHRAPNVLTIQLKRFQFGSGGHFFGGGNKVHKPVHYPLRLNIRPFMSNKNGSPITYTLFASIQHEGYTCNSGHYVANVRCKNQWYHFNDSTKTMRNQQRCLNENSAYILFYIREVAPTAQIKPAGRPQNGPAVKLANNPNSPWAKKEEVKKSRPPMNDLSYAAVVKSSPGHNQKPLKPVATPNQQPKFTAPTYEQRNQKTAVQPSQKIRSFPSNEVGTSVKSPFVPLASDRDKVKFNIGEKNKVKEAIKSPEATKSHEATKRPEAIKKPEATKSQEATKSKEAIKIPEAIKRPESKPKVFEKAEIPTSSPKPRPRSDSTSSVISDIGVTLKVSCGKSFTLEKYPDGDTVCINKNASEKANSRGYTKKRSIVPYGSDSDSSSCSSPARQARSTPDKQKGNGHKKSKLVMDEALNATTSVPGNAHLYNTVTLKDKISHTSAHHAGKPKDLKVFSPKQAQSSPMRRHLNETLSCDTSTSPAKHYGTGEWHTSFDSMQSPSIGSNHSSVHSSGSTHEWSVLRKEGKVTNGYSDRKHDGWTVTTGRKDLNMTTPKDASARRDLDVASSPFEDVSDTALLIKSEKPKDKNSEEYRLYKKSKKHKKHKKRKHLEREHNYAEVSDDSVGRSHKKKKKKHKHKDRDEDREEGSKKHEREEDRVERQRDGEYRKHRKYEREEEGEYKQKYREDDGRDERQYDRRDERHYKGRYDREGNNATHKRSRRDSGSSSEFEWVEKSAPPRPSVSEPVTPSHRWDYHINDGYKRVSSSGTTTPTISRSWDGLKASKVAQELEKVSSYSYGAPVSGWDGSRSQLDADKDREYYSRKRKDSDDYYDDEYDQGKVKKVKHKHHSDHRYNGNLFQQKQDQVNRSKNNVSSMRNGENDSFIRKTQPDRPHPHSNKY